MPVVPLPGFIAGGSPSRGIRLSQSSCVNLFVERDESGLGSDAGAMLVGTPGLARQTVLPSGPIRAMYTASGGRVFAVGAETLYEIFQGGVALARGALRTTTGIVTMADDGASLVLVDGQYGYLYGLSTGTFAQMTDTDFRPASHVVYLDGYMIFNEVGSGRFFWSNLLAPDTIDGLNFATAEASPDPLQAIVQVHRELWLFGSYTTEVWFSTGNADQPFQRIQGALLDIGCAAPFSAIAYNDTVAWLAQDQGGGVMQVVAQGYQARRVSTHAQEFAWSGYPRTSDAVAWRYTQEGHRFLLTSFPSGNATWGFDAATAQWHTRAFLEDNGSLSRHRCHLGTSGLGMVLGGDWQHGLVYALRLDTYTDDGRPLVRERMTPWLATDGRRMRHASLSLEMDMGYGLPDGRVPQVMMQFSDDGQTWSQPASWESLGLIGEYGQRVMWYRLGQARRRLYRLRVSDACPVRLVGAYLDLTPEAH